MKKSFTQHPFFILFLFSFFFGTNLNAQVGQEFWFVAPEVTEKHGDRDVVFHFTAFDEAANVTISMPQENDFTETTILVPANSHKTETYNNPDIFENKPSGNFDKGILITSDADISAYYEVAHGNNPDKFTLKGENALGTEFFIPSQNDFKNHATYPGARERVDIVATEDNTTIEITIPAGINTTNHTAGSSFTITIDRGETYSLEALGNDANIHLGGIQITSDKDIAVTISDDSIERPTNAGHWDLIGDQLIPTDVIGTEYIAMNTTYGQVDDDTKTEDDETITIIEKDVIIESDQRVYILATEDNTTVTLNNNTSTQLTLNKGELRSITIPRDKNAIHIKSDNPIYVYQVTGVPNKGDPYAPRATELGGAILPPVNCTGSISISFTRNLDQRFWAQIMTKDSNKGKFSLKDNNGAEVNGFFNDPSVVNWVTVPGTESLDDPWVTSVIKMGDGTDGISTGNPYTISNDGLFHISILDENNSSMSYGYFSSFSSLRISGPDIFCESDGNITLETQEPMNDYHWVQYVDEFTTKDLGNTPSIIVTEPGTYGVTASSAIDPQCVLEDAIEILSVTPVFSIEGDTVVCPGDPLTFTASPANTYDYTWSDGSTGNTYNLPGGLVADDEIEIELTATYNITASDQCVKTETQSITARSIPEVDWSVSGQEICLGDTLKAVIISGEDLIVEYQWSVNGSLVPNHNEPYIVPTQSGADYSLTVITEDNCDVDKTINLTVHALPDIDISDAAVCPGADHTFQLPQGYDNYLWQGASRANTLSQEYFLTMDTSDSIYVKVTDANGCVGRDSAFFEIYNEQVFSFGADTSVCIGSPIDIEIHDNFTNYQWAFEGNPITTSPNHIYSIANADLSDEGTYSITAEDQNGCDVSGTFDLDVQEVPDIDIATEANLCEGEGNMIKIGVENPLYTSFEWINTSNPGTTISTENYLLISDAGTYELTATQDNGCSNSAQTTVSTWNKPTFDIPDAVFCPNEDISIGQAVPTGWSSPQSSPDDAPRNHTWYTWNEDEELVVYSNEIDLGDAQEGNPEAGVYFLEVHDAVCKFIDQVEISYHELTEVELEDAEICDNATYSLEVPAALSSEVNSYYWSQDGTANRGATNSNWIVSDNDNYSLNIEDNNGCSNEGTMTLSHLPAPKFEIGTDGDKCLGDTLMARTEATFTRYEWNGNTADGQTNVFTTTASGDDLDFSLQIWDENGCTATETTSIDVFALPVADLGPDRAECPGHEITLTVPDFKEIYWTTREQNVTSVTVANGKHKVKVVDDNGCVAEDSMTFTWHKLPDVELGPDLFICPIEYPIQIEAPGGYQGYTWHNGMQGRFITADLMDTLNTVFVTDNNGCIGWDTKVVDILGYPKYSIGNDTTACDSDELVINAGSERISKYAGEETITPFIDYQWSTGNNEQTQEITEPGNYWVEIFDGCFFLRDTINVEYYPTPEITRLDTTYYAQVSVLADNGTQPYQFALDDEDRLQNDNTFKNIENGEHTVYVEDQNECMAFTIFTLNATYDIDVPNFFTPNNDGFNDTWQIEGLERLPDSEVSIFDRYGKLLRKFKASESISWDGEYQNKPVPSDDYWYVIYLQPVEKLIKGNVTVKR